jgi:hypothetical protein
MGVLLTLLFGLALWIVLWGASLMKSFDAFLIAFALVLIAATVRMVVPYLPGRKD